MKKKIGYKTILLILALLAFHPAFSQVTVNDDGSSPNSSAMLEVKSTSKGFLPPRMTTVQRDGISSPAAGLVIYNTDYKGLNLFDGTKWTSLSGGFVCGLCQVSDAEGHVYSTIPIGNQCWMTSNLNTGERLDLPAPQTDNGIIEKYCFNDSSENCTVYGGLYQWNELMQYVHTSGACGICPDGWHIPTAMEYDTLIDLYGGADTAGAALKEAGYAHWYSWSGTSSTNSSGFTALPGGEVRLNNDSLEYYGKKSAAYFWTSSYTYFTPSNPTYAGCMTLDYFTARAIGAGVDLADLNAFSVRCVRVYPEP